MTTPAWPASFEDVLRAHLPLCGADRRLQPDHSLADLGLDSLKLVSLLMALEDGYLVTFPDEFLAAETFATAGSLWEGLTRAAAGSGVAIPR